MRDPFRYPNAATYEVAVPDVVDFAWCPMGCGGTTNDEGGGPCRSCWAELDREDRGDRW